MQSFELAEYMNRAIEDIISDVLKSTFKNPKQAVFLMKYIGANKRNALKRESYEKNGRHIPVFLISSITSSCNLTCKGCYARANETFAQCGTAEFLTADQWLDIFRQASELGVSFNLLAGGEPMLRKDVVRVAAGVKDMIFPVFTNATLLDEEDIALFDSHRNLIPVISIEGNAAQTDQRRGAGTYHKICSVMLAMKKSKLLFGASVTVTTENLSYVASEEFLSGLYAKGCRLVFFIEYVPAEEGTKHLAPTQKERALLDKRLLSLRKQYTSIIFLSFPGDEKDMGGCLAAGRGFFHINPYGAAEACPFSPYSDRNLKTGTLLDALGSPFFKRLQAQRLVGGEHDGGCALFENQALVRECLTQHPEAQVQPLSQK